MYIRGFELVIDGGDRCGGVLAIAAAACIVVVCFDDVPAC